MMALVWRNKIQKILTSRGMSISDLQKEAKMSYPAIHRLATSDVITDDTKAGTLRAIANALQVNVTDLFDEVETED